MDPEEWLASKLGLRIVVSILVLGAILDIIQFGEMAREKWRAWRVKRHRLLLEEAKKDEVLAWMADMKAIKNGKSRKIIENSIGKK